MWNNFRIATILICSWCFNTILCWIRTFGGDFISLMLFYSIHPTLLSDAHTYTVSGALFVISLWKTTHESNLIINKTILYYRIYTYIWGCICVCESLKSNTLKAFIYIWFDAKTISPNLIIYQYFTHIHRIDVIFYIYIYSCSKEN